MRSRLALSAFSIYLALVLLACSAKPPADNTSETGNPAGGKESREHKQAREEKKKEPVIVPAGTAVTISLGSALGSKLSQPGQTFTGTVATDVTVANEVVIPKGSPASGTVTDAKPLGKLAGGATLALRLDSINLNGYDLPVQTSLRSFSAKGKGKRTAVIAGGGAALGALIGGLAGGGKGAAIGAAAGGGAGGGGAAFTGNKDIVLPAESALTFELTQEIKLERIGH
jgi:hypothetical protein